MTDAKWPADDPAIGFLAALDPEQSEALREHGIVRAFRKGQAIFHQGGSSDRVVVLLSGRVKVSSVTEDGKEIVLAFRGPGDLLGELSALDGEPRSASVEAIEPVEALAIPASDFRSYLIAHPEVALLLLRTLSRRLRDADRKRVEYGAHDTVGRVVGAPGRAGRALRRAGQARPADRPADLPGGARRLDRRLTRGREQGAADAPQGRLGRHRAPPHHGARHRGPPPPLGLTGGRGGRGLDSDRHASGTSGRAPRRGTSRRARLRAPRRGRRPGSGGNHQGQHEGRRVRPDRQLHVLASRGRHLGQLRHGLRRVHNRQRAGHDSTQGADDLHPRAIEPNADDDNLTGDYDISSPITIAVKGRGRATISGGGFDRVIQVTPTGRLTASKLKIVSGSVAPFQPTSISGGGGIMSFGTLHLSHSVVDANETLGSSSNNGGGIATSGPATLDHVVVSGNTAGNVGGGVWWWGGHMVIDHSTISGNVSTSSGGGLLIGADAGTNSFLIKNSTVSGNTELADGGNEGGGGINVGDYTNSRMRAVNVTISGNKAYGSGGGVYDYAGQFSLKYATVVRNKAVLGGQPFDHGGGIAGGTIATNSIVAMNRDLNPTDPADDCYGSASVSSSLVGRNTGCAAPPTNLQPAKPHIGRLRDNGGPTRPWRSAGRAQPSTTARSRRRGATSAGKSAMPTRTSAPTSSSRSATTTKRPRAVGG